MAGKQEAIYNNYVKTFDDVVKPEVSNDRPELRDGETMELTNKTRKWGESYSTRVYVTSHGRVIEVEQVSWYLKAYATFENETDWVNFRRPLGMFHYLNT